MIFDTKIAVIVSSEIEGWQKLNVAAFLSSGIVSGHPDSIGAPYQDASGTLYHSLIGEPILVYGATGPELARALDRALSRNVKVAVYTRDMFSTTHDEANRAAVKAVAREQLDLVGVALRAERKVVDKIVDKLKFAL